MTDSVAPEISNALNYSDTRDSITAVKRAVIRSIKSLDVRVRVETTDYFNHSFAPDLVLTWPHLGKREAERYVYLRFNERPEWITEELVDLTRANRQPIVYGLQTAVRQERTEELKERSASSNTLVTDPDGVAELSQIAPSGITGYITRTIFQGGRGLIDQPTADLLTADVGNGFDAARSADRERTASAASTISSFFDSRHAARNLGFLKAIWHASGASTEDFPGGEFGDNDPGDDAIEYLLAGDEIDDWVFWRAIGEGVSLKRLSEIAFSGYSLNLGHLVEANLDRLWARAMRVVSDQRLLDDIDVDRGQLVWRLNGNLLALSGDHFTAYVAPTVGDLKQVRSSDEPSSISVTELRRRSRGIPVDSLEMSIGDRILTYGSEDREDVANDDQLSSLEEAMGSLSRVTKGTLYVGGRRVELDFSARTATARTSGQPPLTEVLGSALPLVWSLSADELQQLDAMIESSSAERMLQLQYFQVPFVETSNEVAISDQSPPSEMDQ